MSKLILLRSRVWSRPGVSDQKQCTQLQKRIVSNLNLASIHSPQKSATKNLRQRIANSTMHG